jgi:hypothetical protein
MSLSALRVRRFVAGRFGLTLGNVAEIQAKIEGDDTKLPLLESVTLSPCTSCNVLALLA